MEVQKVSNWPKCSTSFPPSLPFQALQFDACYAFPILPPDMSVGDSGDDGRDGVPDEDGRDGVPGVGGRDGSPGAKGRQLIWQRPSIKN